ncbi:MAG: ParB/RepB/Spo0J family partition protein, partial [Rhabdochlamydiaceae bacterium]
MALGKPQPPDVVYIPIKELRISDLNARVRPGETAIPYDVIDDLKDSIKKFGLLHPLTVIGPYKEGSEEKYEVICGGRRFRALKELGYQEVACKVKSPSNLSRNDKRLLSLRENINRKDLDIWDVYYGFQEMKKDDPNYTQTKFAKDLSGVTRRKA